MKILLPLRKRDLSFDRNFIQIADRFFLRLADIVAGFEVSCESS